MYISPKVLSTKDFLESILCVVPCVASLLVGHLAPTLLAEARLCNNYSRGARVTVNSEFQNRTLRSALSSPKPLCT
jgi:hypothetical protein